MPRLLRSLVFAFFFAVIITGCKEEAARDVSVVTIAAAESACARGCAWDVDCLDADIDECIEECVSEVEGWARQDAVETFQSCVAGLTCDDDPVDCGERVDPLDSHREFAAKCEAELAECDVPLELDCSVDYDPDDPGAGILRFATPSVIDELSACLAAEDCDDATSCMLEVYERNGI